jgi:hypothetical protein
MCGGGDDSSNDNQDEQVKASGGPGMSPGESNAKFGNTDQAGKSPDVSNYGDMSKDDYVNDVLSSKGYTDNYKGVSSKGGPVTDGKGNAVRSGSYVDAMNRADATFDSYQDYKTERAKAQEAFYDDMEARQQVDQSLVDMAMGGGGYAKGFYNSDGTINENFDPSTSYGMQGPARPGQFNDLGSYLGSSADTFSFPGYSFADPLGTAMDGRISRIDGSALGSEITTQNERGYFDNFSSGYNDDAGFFGRQLEVDQAGNIGLSTGSQRFSDAAGGMVMGLVGGGLFGPLGSALAGATNINTMDAYGENVPGFNSQVQTTTIGGANILGGLLGNALAPKVAGAVGKGIYGGTGNINAAIGGAGAAAAATPYATGLGAQALMGDSLNYMSSDIGGPMDRDIAEKLDSRGFGDSIGGNDGGGNSRPAGQMSSQLAPTGGDGGGTNTGQNVTDANIQSVSGSDVGMGDLVGTGAQTEFDPQAFLMAQAQNMNPNTTQVTDFFGNSANTMDVNPLFSAQAPGVQYLSKGRQRNFGSGIFNVQNAFERKKSRRRGGLGDKLVGVVV